MTGKIDPLFANHPEVVAMEKQTQRFVDEFRAQSKSYLDELLLKENEIERLLTALVRIQGAIHAAREYISQDHGGFKEGDGYFEQTAEILEKLDAALALTSQESK